MFITGPEVVRVTTGEQVGFDELGGAEVHNIRSGVAHFLDESEARRSLAGTGQRVWIAGVSKQAEKSG